MRARAALFIDAPSISRRIPFCSAIAESRGLRNADLAQTFKQLVRTRSHSYRRKRLARRYLTKIRAIKCHVLHALSLPPLSPSPTSHRRHPHQFCSAPSRRHRRKMQPPDCISRYDRIISGKRRLKRLPAARLHRKTGVIPDYNVTAVSWRFTIRFDRQPGCSATVHPLALPATPPPPSAGRRLYTKKKKKKRTNKKQNSTGLRTSSVASSC